MNTVDDDIVPVRTEAMLREEVRRRVQRARRRRRVRQATMSSALVAVLALLLLARTPAGETTVRTPASEGRHDDHHDHHEPDEYVGRPPGATPSRPGAAVPESAPATVHPTVEPPPSVPHPLAQPTEMPRDKSTEVLRSADVRLAAVRMYEVWELGADWAPSRKLVSNQDGHVTDVAWSPEGRQLAYRFNYWTAARNTASIRVLDLASMQSRIVVESSDVAYGSPSFSPDGTMLTFDRSPRPTTASTGLEWAVAVVDLHAPPGNDPWELGPGDMPSWMPDGRILFRCGGRLCASDARGSNRVQVPNSDKAYAPSVSPDGQWVAFAVSDTGVMQVMRIDGSERRTLHDSVSYYRAQWSPDSRRIFYATTYGIRAIGRDGRDLRVVTERRDESWIAVTRR